MEIESIMNLEPTGERMILEHYKSSPEDYLIYLFHVATYRFAEKFIHDKRVLDYGCGSGYGSAQIATGAACVDAVDVAADTIEYARTQFPRDNLRFHTILPDARLPFDDASMDTVLSFQVFEHVADTAHYLSEIRRVLVPGGQLVLATPDRSTRLLPFQRPWNRWHLHEYSASGLSALLTRYFQKVEMLGMTAKSDVIDIELQRCNRIKWLSLPFTLPFLPDSWRVTALNAVHKTRGPGVGRGGPPQEFSFDASDIQIAAGARPSVNLVAVASN